jgi:hypothetical protein
LKDLGIAGKIRFKMYLTRWEDVDCIPLSHDRIQRRAIVNMTLKVDNFLIR